MADNSVNIQTDCEGDRGYLRRQYDTCAVIYECDGTDWHLMTSQLDLCSGGVTDNGNAKGISSTFEEGLTSLLPNGYFSEETHYTVTSVGIEVIEGPYTPTASSITGDTMGTGNTVTAAGTLRRDCQGIFKDLVDAAMAQAHMEFLKDGRKCEALLGTPELLPGGFAIANQDTLTNGPNLCGVRVPLLRSLVIPPSSKNNTQYIFRLKFSTNTWAVPVDPLFPAPADEQVVAYFVRVIFDGFFSDAAGQPVADPSAQAVAAGRL